MTPELKRRLFIFGGIGVLIIVAGAVAAYLILSAGEVSIADASIEAPLISLAPAGSGRLNAVYVNPGDAVSADEPVAEVGTEIVTAKVAGIVVEVEDTIGANVAPGAAVVTEIDPGALRVVGELDENKGLAKIAVGDPVSFTVDAFGGKAYHAIVDEVAPTANSAGVVFNISDARTEQSFDIKARFDPSAYPELKNGMSARMTVYTQ
jgi:multidrug resistance efflux pump